MKRFTLILLLIILLSLAIATPVLAGGDGPDHPGNACSNIYTWGWHKGYWIQLEKFGGPKGRAYGSVVALARVCPQP